MFNNIKLKNIIISVLVFMMFGFCGSAFARTSSDTGMSFYFTTKPPRNVIYTDARPKDNATSSYFNLKSGKNLSTGIIYSIVGSNYQDVGSKEITVKAPCCGFIRQNAYENRVYSVRLKGEKVIREAYVQAFGKWSPDSVKQKGCINNP